MNTIIQYTGILLLLSILRVNSYGELMAQQSVDELRTISVSGEGIVQAIPDMALVRFGIIVRHEDPEEARKMNAETAKNAMNAIRDLGIDESKLSLQNLRLQPVREYDPQTRKQVDKGYEATRDLVVNVEELDNLPVLVSRIVQEGANRLNGITYGLKNQEESKDRALIEAVKRARQKANLMASTLGVSVGSVLQVQEQSAIVPRPVMQLESSPQVMMSKSVAAPEPDAYAAGEIEVRATVGITFQLNNSND